VKLDSLRSKGLSFMGFCLVQGASLTSRAGLR
jgi:hypothetical protein